MPTAPSVRFADDTKIMTTENNNDIIISTNNNKRPAKRPRMGRRPNEEYEDVDDEWEATDEEEEHTLAIAQRKRRYQDDDENDPTDINATTSLAAEGIAIEPFHMKQEESDGTGFFDGDTYIFRRDDKEEPDAWLESLDDKEVSFSKNNVDLRNDKEEESRRQSNNNNNMDQIDPTHLYARMIPLISESETVLKAIARYGNSMKRTPKGECNKLAQDALNTLTSASNSLLLRGQVDIYEKTQKDLINMIPVENKQQNNETADLKGSDAVQWEYEGRQDGKIHGPFSTLDMLGWIQAGYFVGESAVNVRMVRKKLKTMQDDLLNDLLEDDDENKQVEEYERGEWVLSDQVNFERYK